MIDINLIPDSLRKKRRKKAAPGQGLGVPKEAVIGLVGGMAVLLLVVHVLLQALIIYKAVQFKNLKGKTETIATDKTNVERVMAELKNARERFQSVEKIAGQSTVSWARKLNELSDAIPRGVWLNRIALDEDTLLVQGSAVSKNKAEMINVHNFTSNLKGSEAFMKMVLNLELGLIKTRDINQTQIADFTIRADLEVQE